jgi:hypothetical protein
MGVNLVFVDAQLPNVEAGLAEVERLRTDALLASPIVPLYAHLRTIVAFAAKMRLPDIYGFQEAVEAGGLASYGIDAYDAWHRAAKYVARRWLAHYTPFAGRAAAAARASHRSSSASAIASGR